MDIAILGYGTVGSGVYEILKTIENINVKKVLDRKNRLAISTSNIKEIIEDKNITTIVECIGGINPAYEYIKTALENKKNVVTANKAVVAKHLEEFLTLSKKNNVYFLFEASVGGGIPLLASIEKVKRIDTISEIYGILNGTSNFIIDNMLTKNKDFDETLKIAQQLGYAEADPKADIDGYDVFNKIIIATALAFNEYKYDNIPTYSMKNIQKTDIDYLNNKNLATKYIGEAKKINSNNIEISVMLNIFKKNTLEANTPLNFNIATIIGKTVGELKIYGQGAGKLPTANAIVQDIIDIKNKVYREQLNITNKLHIDLENNKNIFLIRTNKSINNNLIEKYETFKNNVYNYTKPITFNELNTILNELNNNYLVAKIKSIEEQ